MGIFVRRHSPTRPGHLRCHTKHKLLYAALARIAMQRMGKFNAQALANTAWAFVNQDQA